MELKALSQQLHQDNHLVEHLQMLFHLMKATK